MALTAAETLVTREGLAGFSMRKVALAMGYTVGNLYLLFGNQDDLLAEVSMRTADALTSTCAASRPRRAARWTSSRPSPAATSAMPSATRRAGG